VAADHADIERSAQAVSAVIAVYNPEPELFRQAVASVLSQTMPVLELVLVNDGGSEAFRSVLPDDGRIRVFTKPNEGVAVTRNFAIGQCRGDYIAFLDQDDFWYSDKLASQIAMIDPNRTPCMVVSPVDVIDGEGKIRDKKSSKVLDKYLSRISGDDLLPALADENFIHSSSPVVHREVFRVVGGFDDSTRPHDDWDMYLRIALAGFPVYGYTEKALSVWRMHEANESRKRMAMMESKCAVERKALQAGVPAGIEPVLKSNLALDKVVLANLWYNEKEFTKFRDSLLLDLPELIRWYLKGGRQDSFSRDFRLRARDAIFKSLRRLPFSFFPWVHR
jgi:glycosyltransferase involved in cell wall biosynthesis